MQRDDLHRHLRILAITNRLITRGSPEEVTDSLIVGGVTAIMLREKDLTPAELFRLGVRLRDVCRARGVPLLVNNSLEVAMALDADGVHFGRDSIPPGRARQIAPPQMICGFSAHDESELHRAHEWGMDYCTLSPVFFPTSKEMSSPTLGIEGLARIAAQSPIPVVALGGIALDNARACLDAGAVGIAAIGTLYGAEDPCAAAAAFRHAIDT
ncbi:MAG: thiamine phosphate synthase [Candidatus Sumerlaeia bacterium]|nr:thiamine phosphate synthase [Candidatus Sumerlaeia bacterium]